MLKQFKKVLVPELNCGQLLLLLRAKFLVDAKGLNKVQGQPFLVSEIEATIEKMLADESVELEGANPTCSPTSSDVGDLTTSIGRLNETDTNLPEASWLRRRLSPTLKPARLRHRPGSPLVPRLRRLLDPGPDEEGPGHARHRRARRWCSSPASAAPAGSRTT